ncbi:MAG: hypothetical protein DDT31_01597 [Syntrophomonadaceae bacterium]|nr:hypothetical protein [Bacillota bacterium]
MDLAKLFNAKYRSDAVEILKSKWKEAGKKGKLDIDAESDYVEILASKKRNCRCGIIDKQHFLKKIRAK